MKRNDSLPHRCVCVHFVWVDWLCVSCQMEIFVYLNLSKHVCVCEKLMYLLTYLLTYFALGSSKLIHTRMCVQRNSAKHEWSWQAKKRTQFSSISSISRAVLLLLVKSSVKLHTHKSGSIISASERNHHLWMGVREEQFARHYHIFL